MNQSSCFYKLFKESERIEMFNKYEYKLIEEAANELKECNIKEKFLEVLNAKQQEFINSKVTSFAKAIELPPVDNPEVFKIKSY